MSIMIQQLVKRCFSNLKIAAKKKIVKKIDNAERIYTYDRKDVNQPTTN